MSNDAIWYRTIPHDTARCHMMLLKYCTIPKDATQCNWIQIGSVFLHFAVSDRRLNGSLAVLSCHCHYPNMLPCCKFHTSYLSQVPHRWHTAQVSKNCEFVCFGVKFCNDKYYVCKFNTWSLSQVPHSWQTFTRSTKMWFCLFYELRLWRKMTNIRYTCARAATYHDSIL